MDRKHLNRQKQLDCYQLYKENAYAYASINYLAAKLVENGIVVKRGRSAATTEFQEVVDRHYVAFARDSLVSMMVYGFIAWDTQKIDKVCVPVVIPGTHLQIEIIQEHGDFLPTYQGRYVVNNEIVKSFRMTSPPDLVHMTIDSPLCKVLPYHIFEACLLQNAAKADKRNAETPLVLENLATKNGFWALKGISDEAEGAAHAANISSSEIPYTDIGNSMGCQVQSRMQSVDEALVRIQENYVKNLNTIGELDSMQQSKLYVKQKQETLPRMQLPPHTRVQNVNFPTTRGDLRDILRMNAQRICVAIGVPPDVLIKDHHVKLDQNQSMITVLQKINEVRKIVQPILTEALLECTKGDDFILALLSGDDRFSVQPEIEIVAQLPPTDELVKLHQQSLLPTKYIRTHLSQKYGFDIKEYEEEDLPAKAAKVTEEDGPGRSDGRTESEAVGAAEEQ
jgi:hypothetical protein